MLSVNLLADDTEIESVRKQFRQNASETELKEAKRVFDILLPVGDVDEVSLSEEQEDYVKRIQNEMDLFFYNDSNSVEGVNELRLFCMSNQAMAKDLREIISYIVELDDVELEEAQDAKEHLNSINSDMDFDFTIPSP